MTIRPLFSSGAVRETSWRILKNLVVVVIGVGAFLGLRFMENKKLDFYKEKAEPLIIVEQNAPSEASDPEYAIKLERNKLDFELAKIIQPSAEEAKQWEKSEKGISDQSRKDALKKFRDTVVKSISEARRNPFESEEKFVGYLSENIGKAETEAKDLLSNKKKARFAEIEELQKKFIASPADFESNLKEKSDADFGREFDEDTALTKRLQGTGDLESKQVPTKEALTKVTSDLAEAAKKVEKSRDEKNRDEISEKAYQTRDGLYSKFGTIFLPNYIKERKIKSPHPNTVAEMVLDEHRGGHALYQVIYSALVGILVFAVLSPICLLLLAFPPFAASTEPLTEQAKKLLSRDAAGATMAGPEILKSLALSVAAIGIGAAVVIGNSPVTTSKGTGEEIAEAGETGNLYPPPPGTPPRFPSPSPVSSPGSSPSPSTAISPSPSPEPNATPVINLYPTYHLTPTVDSDKLAQLQRDYGSTKTVLDQILNEKLPSKLDQGVLSKLVTTDQFTTVSDAVKDIPAIKKNVEMLSTDLSNLTTKTIPDVRRDFAEKNAELSTKLDATNTAIADFREGTQEPSILRRAGELLGRERYQVTPASIQVLQGLMCQKTDCPSTSPPSENCCIAPSAQLILDRLKALTRVAPMRKNTLLQRLGISRPGNAAPSPWENLILRYTRAPF